MAFPRIIVVVVCVVAIALQLTIFSSSSYPGFLESLPPSSLLPAPSNGKLQDVMKLGEGLLMQPEDVAVDENGVLHTVTRDGSVKKMHKNGTWENWCHIPSDSLLGITTTAAGDLIVCDARQGLLKVSEEGVKLLTSHIDGAKIRFADDVIESADGTLYFSDASTKFGFHNWQLDLLETEPHGRLLKYEPSTNTTSVVLDGLAFANGVALSADQHYLLVCESWKYRCLKYWLQGHKKGETQIFIDKLPGRPDNINLAPDGSFWIALLESNPMWPRFVYNLPGLKYVTGAFPEFFSKWVINVVEKAMVVNVGSDGKMIRGFDDPTGKVMRFVTSAVEFEGHLYFGTLYNDFLGKLPLSI
ncbi:protein STRICTOSIDINE SYNTHASE-LIKE 4-like [Salvia miltiorrhiza]|uniref:protein STRICTOSIDINE SYNTHASE-LIKE 4-like n=1 Tax=Salvia miltiorrhiza TaxID=226208 RepID=UPI0025AD05BA|nr:protein STRICTOSIDINE SYNTHASE-LIKE 4-like [Salvia miltiorrhiza]